MKKKCLLIVLCLVGIIGLTKADEPADTLGIIGRIAENPHLTVSHPEKLAERLLPVRGDISLTKTSASPSSATGGYRVQVFSGNNPATARSHAHGRAAAIRSSFPEWATYVTFDSPYWRVKVGDFRSYDEGTAALSLLKKTFPGYAKEMRLVRDRIKNGN